MNKNYFEYLFKSRKSLCVVVIVINVIVFVMSALVFGIKSEYEALIVITVVSFILAYVLVPIIYNFIHDKKAVDSYFSLPVKRKELLITSQIFIDLVILVPFVVLALINFVLVVGNGNVLFGPFLLYVLTCVFGIIGIVLFNTMIYTLANSVFDGITMILAYAMLPVFAVLAIAIFQENLIPGSFYPLNENRIIAYLSLPGSIFLYLNACLERLMYLSKDISFPISLVVCELWHIVISIFGLKKHFISRKVERAQSISDDFFSYPFIIHIYAFILVFFISTSLPLYAGFSGISEHLLLYVIVFICFLIACFVYRRKIAIKLKDVVYFIIIIVITVCFFLISAKTKAFGLAYKYNHDYQNIAYRFTQFCYDTDNDELSSIVKKAYPNVINFNIHIDGLIKSDKMDDNKEVLALLEKKRLEAIDNFYTREGDNVLMLSTDFDENAVDVGPWYFPDDYNYAHYYHASKLSLEEIKKFNEITPVEVEILLDDEFMMYEQISLNEVLMKANMLN